MKIANLTGQILILRTKFNIARLKFINPNKLPNEINRRIDVWDYKKRTTILIPGAYEEKNNIARLVEQRMLEIAEDNETLSRNWY